jgi:phosphatidylglycerol lysyltransferase
MSRLIISAKNTIKRFGDTATLNDSQLLVWLVSTLTFLAGFFAFARPIAERLPDKITDKFLPLDTAGTASYLFLGFGLALMYLGYELSKRKRAAWWLALIFTIFNFVLHALLEPNLISALIAGLALVALLLTKNQFCSRVHSDNLWQGLRILLISIIFAITYGILGFWLLDKRDFGTTFSFGEAITRTLKSYLLLGNNDLVAHSRYARWFLHSLAIVGGLALAYGVFSIFRPLRNRLHTLPGERAKAQKILQRYGGETDDFFKLWPTDKSYFFSSDGKAFVAYGVARGVAVCFASPAGDPESIASLLKQFKVFCMENGWLAVFAQATNRFVSEFKNESFHSLLIGADAVINLDQFFSKTCRNKYFRNIINRFEKGGFVATRCLPPHSPELIKEIRSVSNSWMNRAGRKQWRFFTGHFSRAYFQQTPLFIVRDSKGRMLAFANELPCFKKGEATVDLMRHRQKVPTNLMDYLFIELMGTLQKEGYHKFNLGLSPLAAKGFASSSSDKLIAALYNSNQKIIAFKGLHRYKTKYEPEWEPRYLYYQGSAARLPQIGLAVVKLIRY